MSNLYLQSLSASSQSIHHSSYQFPQTNYLNLLDTNQTSSSSSSSSSKSPSGSLTTTPNNSLSNSATSSPNSTKSFYPSGSKSTISSMANEAQLKRDKDAIMKYDHLNTNAFIEIASTLYNQFLNNLLNKMFS